MVNNSSFKAVLVEDLEYRKPFTANRMFPCSCCGNKVEEGDEFFFFGDKRKVCNDCRESMRELVEEQIHG